MFEVFEDIEFFEEEHKYKFKSRPDLTPTSVTAVLGRYEKPFDNFYWATREADGRGVDPQQVLDEWEYNKNYACDNGTICHWYMECALSNNEFTYDNKYEYVREGFDIHKPQMDQYLKDSSKKLIPVKSELIVGDTEYNITGMIDQLYKDHDGKYYLFDWKTNKKFDKESRYKLQGILSELDSSKWTTYSLQLLLYKHIIEKNTDIKIEDCFIVWFGLKEKSYNIYKVRDLENYIPLIIEDFIKENK